MTTEQRHAQNEQMWAHTHPALVAKLRRVIAALESQGWQPVVASGWRSPEEQRAIYERGDSTVLFSFHNATRLVKGVRVGSALANDVVDSRYQWDIPQTHSYWKALGAAGHAEGLVWGGDWTHFIDVAHLQLLGNDRLKDVQNGYVPPIPTEEEEEMRHITIIKDGKVLKGLLDEQAGVTYVGIRDAFPTATFSWDKDQTRLEVTAKK